MTEADVSPNLHGNPSTWFHGYYSPQVSLDTPVDSTVTTFVDVGMNFGMAMDVIRFTQYYKDPVGFAAGTYTDAANSSVRIDFYNNEACTHDGTLATTTMQAFVAYWQHMNVRMRRLSTTYWNGLYSCPALCWTAAQYHERDLSTPTTTKDNYKPVFCFAVPFGRLYVKLTRTTALVDGLGAALPANLHQIGVAAYGPINQPQWGYAQ